MHVLTVLLSSTILDFERLSLLVVTLEVGIREFRTSCIGSNRTRHEFSVLADA